MHIRHHSQKRAVVYTVNRVSPVAPSAIFPSFGYCAKWQQYRAVRLNDMSILPPFLPLASTFNCSPTSFSAILPVNASVAIAYSIPEGGTFQVPARNIAYSALPTDLRALCVAQIETKAAQRQLLALVSLSLQVVERVCFLAVGMVVLQAASTG